MSIDPQAERDALKSLLELMEAADRCKQLYARAQMEAPEPLRRFLGLNRSQGEPKPALTVPDLEFKRPSEYQTGWISVAAASASPPSIVLAVLRKAGHPLRAKDVVERMRSLVPDINAGSVANAGTKLEGEKVILRKADGWILMNSDMAPVMFEDRLWGPVAIFGVYELAAYRRDAVLHLLRLVPNGLQTSQLLEQLSNAPWMKDVTINKEVVQGDTEVLQEERRIRRRGASRKWELTPEKEE